MYLTDIERGTLVSLPREGGEETVLVEDQPGALHPIACGTDLCWLSKPEGRGTEWAVMRRDAAGAVSTVSSRFSRPLALVFDGASFFVPVGLAGDFLRIPAEDGARVIASERGGGLVAFNDDCLFWSSSWGVSGVSRTPANGAGGE